MIATSTATSLQAAWRSWVSLIRYRTPARAGRCYLRTVDTKERDRRRTQAILEKIKSARRVLYGSGTAKQRGGGARIIFSAYTRDGPLAPYVRDVHNASTLKATELALNRLESLARAFAEAD